MKTLACSGGSGQGHRGQSTGGLAKPGKRAAAATMRRKRLILRDRLRAPQPKRPSGDSPDALHTRARSGNDQLARHRVRRDGRASAARRSSEFRQIFPQPGWVEHDATEIWATQSGVHARGAGQGRRYRTDVAAIGITNQRETTVVWDRATGRAASRTRSSGRTGAPPRFAMQLRAAGKAQAHRRAGPAS